jgi:hypothetical protein
MLMRTAVGVPGIRRTSLVGVLISTAALASGAQPTGSAADPPGTPRCDRGWHFSHITKKRTRQRVIQKRRVENRTRRRSTTTFESKRSRTVGWSSKWNIGGGIDAVIFAIRADGERSASRSITAQTGVSVTATIPPKRAVVGTYGVFRRPVRGRLKRGDRYGYCRFNKRVTVKVPVGSGWRIKDRRL